jgi:glycosyltransferase involved in cell wall biosynthesis
MNTRSDLTIVIPARNEAKLIPRLLNSLLAQNYSKMPNTKIFVADANSTDGTSEVVKGFSDRLNISVIAGGLPAAGRNAGAALADTDYVLFLDADIELASESLIRRAVEVARGEKLHCVTTSIICREGTFADKLSYQVNDLFQYLSCLHRPFSTGMFMLFDKQRFVELGGFDTRVLFAEDYHLSRQVRRSKFRIVRGGVYTTNRRLRKMGHLRVAGLFFWTVFNHWNKQYFLRDHGYWKT